VGGAYLWLNIKIGIRAVNVALQNLGVVMSRKNKPAKAKQTF